MRPLTAGQVARMSDTTEATFEVEAVRRRFPLVEDVYGNETRDLDAPDDLEVSVALWQDNGTETTADRDQQVSDWLARFPAGFEVTGRDLVLVGDRIFEVVGPPVDAKTHVRARLRHVEG